VQIIAKFVTRERGERMEPNVEVIEKETLMTFGEALQELTTGGKCRRLEWGDPGTYITIFNGQLMIYSTDDKKLHPLVVSLGDIQGMDWVLMDRRSKN